MHDVLGLILGGGRGTRLNPLTEKRSKPAVPFAGKYRLIDIPISNCIHAGIEKIAILTQFNSVSLHRHIHSTYRRDIFSKGWVDILAAEQTLKSNAWYQGTADAVRQHISRINDSRTKYVLILAGDHLYQMDYRKFVEYHIQTNADITLAVQPTDAENAPSLGILKRATDGKIENFYEKPKPEKLNGLESMPGSDKPFMASMGIYVFSTNLLCELLETEGDDFGNDIIPRALPNYRVMGFIYDGYWADIGTIRRFYEVNLEMVSQTRPYNFISQHFIYTHPRFLPPSEVHGARLNRVLLSDGSCVYEATITNSVIGLRSKINSQVIINDSVLMGADYYETESELEENKRLNRPNIGVGAASVIETAIIDKNARIGCDVHLRNLPDRPDSEADNWVAREGLVIVRKNATIPDGTVI